MPLPQQKWAERNPKFSNMTVPGWQGTDPPAGEEKLGSQQGVIQAKGPEFGGQRPGSLFPAKSLTDSVFLSHLLLLSLPSPSPLICEARCQSTLGRATLYSEGSH